MPNYSNFVEEYNMQDDLATITQADGKYYRLPGLKETSAGLHLPHPQGHF